MKRWVRHSRSEGPRWSPVPENKDVISSVAPVPNEEELTEISPTPISSLNILPPTEPNRVVALARNYRDLISEENWDEEPLMFLMTPSSVIGDDETIKIPEDRGPTWAEVELACVIDKTAKDIDADEADDYIRGYTIVNDVTTENLYDRNWHLPRGKALDTYCPTGPYLVQEVNTSDLEMTTRIDGEVTQKSSTSNRLFNDAEALSLITSMITLEPGDLVSTGTPGGALDSKIQPGSEVVLEIEKFGNLRSNVEFK